MELSRIKQVSRKYNISPSTLYRWACYEKFPKLFKRVEKLLFLDEEEFRRIAKKGKDAKEE